MRNRTHSSLAVGVLAYHLTGLSLLAQPFAANPAYPGECPAYPLSSSEVTNHPTAAQYERLVSDFNWTYRSLQDRYTVLHSDLPSQECPTLTGGFQAVRYDLRWLQQKTEGIIGGFVSHTGGVAFAGATAIPMFSKGVLLTLLGIPANYFDPYRTPYRGFYYDCVDDWEVPYTNYKEHGVKNLMRIVRELDCTVETRNRSSGTTESLKRFSQGLVDGYNAPLAISNCVNAWSTSAWTTNSDGYIYRFARYQWHEPVPGGRDVATATRMRSKPKCDGIPVPTNATYQWSVFAQPGMTLGPVTQMWDGVTFVNGQYMAIANGNGSATNIIHDAWLFEGEPCPWTVEPLGFGADCRIEYLQWIFLWDFDLD